MADRPGAPGKCPVGKTRTLIRIQNAGKSMLIKVPYAGQSAGVAHS